MLDCHTHILPGLDDGAADLATALGICQALRAGGVTTVVATPHWCSPRFGSVEAKGIQAAWDGLTAAVTGAVPGLTLVLGAEHHLSGFQQPEDFVATLRPFGGGTRVLVELPDDHLPINTANTLFSVIRAGYKPVIAHPERCKGFANLGERLEALLEAGVLLQLTLGNLLGRHGLIMRFKSRRLLKRYGRHCIIASDSHDLNVRRPRWAELPQAWKAHVPTDLAALERWVA